MWSEVSWSDHSPDAARSRRWAPHPDRDASEYRRSSAGEGLLRRAPPSSRWFLDIHQEMSLSTCRGRGTGRCGGSVSVDQLDFRCHWRERIRSFAWGTSFSSDDMCPNNTCHRQVGGLGWARNFLARERNFCIRASVGNARADTVSMTMPRYSTDLDGEKSDFSVFITMPSEQQSERSWSTCCLVLICEVDKISQSSRYRSRRIPRA